MNIPNLFAFTVIYPSAEPSTIAKATKIHFVEFLELGVMTAPKNVN